MRASIFIPTSNRPASLHKVLTSLSRQQSKKFEVIIVEHLSNKKTRSIINKFQKKLDIIYLVQFSTGLVKAANLALKTARGDIFVRTDDDVEMGSIWLQSILKNFRDPDIGGVTGPTIVPASHRKNRDVFLFDRLPKNSIIFKTYSFLFFDGNPFRVSRWHDSGAFSLGSNYPESKKNKRQEVANLEACNFAVRTNLVRKIGGFNTFYDTGLGDYHEAEVAFKLRRRKFKIVFDPNAALYHYPSKLDIKRRTNASFNRMVNFIVFYKKNIMLDSVRKLILFSLYLCFLNSYYVYLALRHKDVKALGSIPGTVIGIFYP